jgi:hypothetical protein
MTVLMRRHFDVRLKRRMLLRAGVEETPDEWVVITVYKTSRVAKDADRVQFATTDWRHSATRCASRCG